MKGAVLRARSQQQVGGQLLQIHNERKVAMRTHKEKSAAKAQAKAQHKCVMEAAEESVRAVHNL